jgi:hypothetical protein
MNSSRGDMYPSSSSSQHIDSPAGGNSTFSPPSEFQSQFRTPHDSPQRPQEYQAFAIPFQHEQSGAPEVFPVSLAHQQRNQPLSPQHYREQPAYGLQTPASTASYSYYEGSPDRSSQNQQMHQYASSSYSQGYGSTRYQGDAHTDTESVYAYSEGANVVPSRYGGPSQVPPPPRSDMQRHYGREGASHLYLDEAGGRAGGNRSVEDREWGKVQMTGMARR